MCGARTAMSERVATRCHAKRRTTGSISIPRSECTAEPGRSREQRSRASAPQCNSGNSSDDIEIGCSVRAHVRRGLETRRAGITASNINQLWFWLVAAQALRSMTSNQEANDVDVRSQASLGRRRADRIAGNRDGGRSVGSLTRPRCHDDADGRRPAGFESIFVRCRTSARHPDTSSASTSFDRPRSPIPMSRFGDGQPGTRSLRLTYG